MVTIIKSKFGGRCRLCGQRIPRDGDLARFRTAQGTQAWGHPSCVAELRAEGLTWRRH